MGRHRLLTISIASVLLVGASAGALAALGPGIAAANHGGDPYAVGQGGECVAELHPLGDGSLNGSEYYDYRNYGSYGTMDLQQTWLSQFYVYEGSDGTNLVFLHDRMGDGTGGGAVSFDVTGLPADGEWTVEDDDYLGQDDVFDHSDTSSELHWMYGNNKTDGAVFLGLGSSGWTEITIDPAFKEESYGNETGWEQAIEGPNDWVVRSEDGTVTPLDMQEPVSIRAGSCEGVSPEAAVSGPDSTTTGATVTLDASNPESPTSPIAYAWDVRGNGSVDANTTEPTVEHEYDEPGEVTATVTVTDRFGNTDTATKTISVVDDTPPSASIDVPGTVATGETFTANGSGSSDETAVESYAWDFGDGTTASGVAANHSYDEVGTYTVTLTVEDSTGTTDTANATVEVTGGEPPTAALSAPSEVPQDEPVTLDAGESTDDGTVSEYLWDLDGDGSVDTTTANATTEHNFTEAGDVTVTVTVVDDAGNAASANVTLYVLDETPPAASLWMAESATAGSEVTLDAGASTDNLGVEGYEWTFGDGSGPVSTDSDAISHTYGSPGNYTATVTVVDVDGNEATANATMAVESPSEGNDTAPTASVATNTTSTSDGVPVSFDATGSSDSDGDIVGWSWDFGDGAEGAGNTTEHTYETGEYTATLTVTDDAGNTDSADVTITVGNPAPEAAFTFEPTSPEPGQDVTFDASNSSDASGIDSYEWTFGDGANATGETVTHAFDSDGEHDVTLTVTDTGGESTSVQETVTVAAEDQSGGTSGGDDGGGSGGGGGGSSGGGGGAPATTPEPEPEIDVTTVSANETSVLVGQAVTVNATVVNRGDAAGSEQIGPVLERRPVALEEVTLEPGETRNVTFVVPMEEPGVQTIGLGEREATVTVESSEPDTAIASLRVEDPIVDVGETATVVATVENRGAATGEQVVSLGVFGEVVDREVVSVPPGETRTVRFTQRFDEGGNYTLNVGDRGETIEVRGDRSDRTNTFDASDAGGPTPGLGLVVGGGISLMLAALLVGSRV